MHSLRSAVSTLGCYLLFISILGLLGQSNFIYASATRTIDSVNMEVRFGLRECTEKIGGEPGEQECIDTWRLENRLKLKLDLGGGSCLIVSDSVQTFAETKGTRIDPSLIKDIIDRERHPLKQTYEATRKAIAQEARLGCGYGIFDLPGSDAVFLPLFLVETDANDLARLTLSLARAEDGIPEIVRTDVVLPMSSLINASGGTILRGREIERSDSLLSYPLFVVSLVP
ncbi:MAG: hypothetical protein HRU19_24905 [Pseudobacteriovorax sp.]|nr:hypothetical protein [Pseudobacteriovorax sp.]